MSKSLKAVEVPTTSQAQPLLADYLDPEELAKELRRTRRTVDRWDRMGIGPPRHLLGNRVLYKRSDVIAWLETLKERKVGRPRGRKQ